MKIVFFGTPQIAVKSLISLYADPNIEIVAVVTQSDKVVGRKKVLTEPPVKKVAKDLNLTVLQPKNSNQLYSELEKVGDVDFFVVLAYGMIFPQKVLDLPKFGSINIHMSLLPRYRGASPIQSSFLNGDKETGVSVIKMNLEMDKGGICFLKRVLISDDDNQQTLSEKLSGVSASIIPSILVDIKAGLFSPIPQDESKATYCKKITKKDGLVDLEKSAVEIKNMMRAYTPWPGVFIEIKGKNLKIIDMDIDENQSLRAGAFKVEDRRLKIGTKKGVLLPKVVQLQGKKEMEITDFLNGYAGFFS